MVGMISSGSKMAVAVAERAGFRASKEPPPRFLREDGANPTPKRRRRGAATAQRVYAASRGIEYSPNGEREVKRRQRQIAAGQLTEANGLVRG